MNTDSFDNKEIFENTVLLVDVLTKLGLHPLVGLKLFIKDFDGGIDNEKVLDIPFYGHDIKIYRMGYKTNFNTWRLTKCYEKKINTIFSRLIPEVKQYVLSRSKELEKEESESVHNTDMHMSRQILSYYNRKTIKIRATLYNK